MSCSLTNIYITVLQFNLKLPDEVEEYYTIKEKCLAAGWVPGESAPEGQGQQPNGPHRVMAQALMKRCIADIPIVTHIQKEATGMNKLYSQSMCSVNQWRAYQKAETLVSQEVEEVRAEADDIEPGWSQVRHNCMYFFCTTKVHILFFHILTYYYYFRSFGDRRCNIIKCSRINMRQKQR
jgi:Preprotein translocase subunit Sec66